MVTCAWLIFARSRSKRLPNKCYLDLNGKTMVEHIVFNLLSNKIRLNDIFLCTSYESADNRLVDIASNIGIQAVRGSEIYPIKRYFDNIDLFSGFKYISRVNGDSPFYEGRLGVDPLCMLAVAGLDPDIISNLRERVFPSGMSVEIYKKTYLDALLSSNPSYPYLEHMSDLIDVGYSLHSSIVDITPRLPIQERFKTKLTIDSNDDFKYLLELICSEEALHLREYFRSIDIEINLAS